MGRIYTGGSSICDLHGHHPEKRFSAADSAVSCRTCTTNVSPDAGNAQTTGFKQARQCRSSRRYFDGVKKPTFIEWSLTFWLRYEVLVPIFDIAGCTTHHLQDEAHSTQPQNPSSPNFHRVEPPRDVDRGRLRFVGYLIGGCIGTAGCRVSIANTTKISRNHSGKPDYK
jgi:hypothetical protein